MNEQIKQLESKAWGQVKRTNGLVRTEDFNEKFAELIIEECRTVVSDVYRKTPLELCGPLLTADQEIAIHFYGVKE